MLTPSAVANPKGKDKPYKLTGGRGMYLLVRKDGSRWWRFDYRRPGSSKWYVPGLVDVYSGRVG